MKVNGLIKMVMCMIAMCYGHAAMALDVDTNASIGAFSALSITKTADMNFGNVSYETPHSGSIFLGTDGVVILRGSSGLFLESNAPTNAGAVVVTGDTGGSVIDISCQRNGTMTDGAGNSLRVQRAEIAISTGVPARSGTRCLGLNNIILTVDTNVDPVPMILMGGRINTNNDAIDGDLEYNTLNAGGSPVRLRVVYQ